jgi:hypothetical protein
MSVGTISTLDNVMPQRDLTFTEKLKSSKYLHSDFLILILGIILTVSLCISLHFDCSLLHKGLAGGVFSLITLHFINKLIQISNVTMTFGTGVSGKKLGH